MDNAAALLAGLENPSLERVAAQVAALRRRLDARELKPLRELMLLWAQRVSRRRLNLDLGIEDMAELDRLHESGELEVFSLSAPWRSGKSYVRKALSEALSRAS